MAAEADWRSPWPQRLPIGHKMHMDIMVIEAADVKYQGIFAIRDHFLDISSARESIGPLPSSYV